MRKIILCMAFLYFICSCLAATTTEHEQINETVVNDLRSKIVFQNETNAVLIKELRSQIKFQKQTNQKLRSQIEFQQEALSNLFSLLNKLNKSSEESVDVSKKLGECEDQLKQINACLIEKELEIQRINEAENQKQIQSQLQLNQTKSFLDDSTATSCLPFGNYPGVHQIKVSGFGFFDVKCDIQSAGPGWLVIQQRVGSIQSFDNDWATYRKGFGSFNGDFFLGLEKIHRLTNSQRFELLVHFVGRNGSTYYAQYDNFKISDEDTGYALSLGAFNGNVKDGLRDSEHMKFSTFDRDQDALSFVNCAQEFKNGWWHKSCFDWNLNLIDGIEETLNFFGVPLKSVQMLIRPKE